MNWSIEPTRSQRSSGSVEDGGEREADGGKDDRQRRRCLPTAWRLIVSARRRVIDSPSK